MRGLRVGHDEEKLFKIENYDSETSFNEEERIALRFAEGMTKTTVEVDEILFSKLKEFYSENQIVEIATIVSFQNFNAKFIGDKSLSGRNMYELIKPLKKMGVEINSKNNSLPILIKGCNETIPIIYNQKSV